jgi:crotonobetainyl-CoA:carnitine CoA-transferase CaiB-like acyl-CoA transferase
MKLQGVKVIDLSWFLPGPLLTLTFADHGADVVKVEPPGEGDPGRHIGPFDGEESVFFRNLNRGKKSVVLDLKTPAGLEALRGLCDDADVLVESFRPGVADRLGIGYADAARRNPGIVYCSISAFGAHGAYVRRPAHDLALEALTGVLSLTLGDDGRPAVPGLPIADLVAGLQAQSAVLMALLRRKETGKGDRIDIAMHDALLAASANVIGPALLGMPQPLVKQQRTTGGAAFYRIYDTADGRQIVLAGQEPKFITTLLRALDRPDLIPLCTRGPGPHQQWSSPSEVVRLEV